MLKILCTRHWSQSCSSNVSITNSLFLTGTQAKVIIGSELSAMIFHLHSIQNILQNIWASSKNAAMWQQSKCKNKFQQGMKSLSSRKSFHATLLASWQCSITTSRLSIPSKVWYMDRRPSKDRVIKQATKLSDYGETNRKYNLDQLFVFL